MKKHRSLFGVGLFALLLGTLSLFAWISWADTDDDDDEPQLEGPITAIVDAKVLSMTPDAEAKQGVVILQGNRVRAAGSLVAIPQGARVINARGKVVTPGLALANTRLGLVEISLEKSTRNDSSRTHKQIRAAFHVRYGYNYMSSLIPIARVEGITAVMVRPFGGLIAGQSMLVDLQGPPPKSLIKESLGMHAAIHVGHAADSWMRLNQALERARFFLSNQSDYNMGRARNLRLSRSQLIALSRVVQRHMPLILEVHRAADILEAIRFAKKQNIRLVLSGVSEGWMVAKALAEAQLPVLLSAPRNLPVRFDRLGSRYDNAALLHKAGVFFAFGGRGGAHNIRSIRHEAGIAVAHGLPRMAALRALTHNIYKIFGLSSYHGTLETGKIANVVLWSGDPLELSSRAEQVWIRGKQIEMRSRQTMLRERYRSLKGLFLQKRPPLPPKAKKPKEKAKPTKRRTPPARRRPVPRQDP